MLKMVDGTGIIGVDMICPLGVSTPQPPNYDRVELEGTGMLVLPNSLDAPLERLELGGKTEQAQTSGKNLANPSEFVIGTLAGDTGNIINLKQYITTGYIPVIPGKRYSTSCGNKFLAYTIIAYDKEKTKINYPMNMSSEMPEGAAYIRLSYKKIDMTNVTESDMEELKKVCMVNEGSTVLPYEPYTGGKPSPSLEYEQEVKNAGKWNEGTQKYEVDVKVTNAEQNWNKEQTLTLTSDRPLTKWDRLVEQGGEIGWLYRSEIDDNVKPSRTDLFPYGFSLYKNQENGTYTYKSTNIKKAIGFQTSYCKQFRNKDAAYQSAELWHYSDQPSMKIQYFNTDIATVEEFIEWMESNPLTMVFKTESATFAPLPQSEQNAIRALKTYYPTTVITADGGEVDPDIKVTYRKEI
nr:MAG TPA: hypothetical protein [Caudoviricetes sp.]